MLLHPPLRLDAHRREAPEEQLAGTLVVEFFEERVNTLLIRVALLVQRHGAEVGGDGFRFHNGVISAIDSFGQFTFSTSLSFHVPSNTGSRGP